MLKNELLPEFGVIVDIIVFGVDIYYIVYKKLVTECFEQHFHSHFMHTVSPHTHIITAHVSHTPAYYLTTSIHIHQHTYTYTSTRTHTPAYVHIHQHTYTYASTRTPAHAHQHTYTYTSTRTHTPAHVHQHTYTSTRTSFTTFLGQSH